MKDVPNLVYYGLFSKLWALSGYSAYYGAYYVGSTKMGPQFWELPKSQVATFCFCLKQRSHISVFSFLGTPDTSL